MRLRAQHGGQERRRPKARATKEEKSDTLFFYATEDAGIAEQVVRLCDIKPPKGEATLVLLDLDDDGAYYLTNTSDVSRGRAGQVFEGAGPAPAAQVAVIPIPPFRFLVTLVFGSCIGAFPGRRAPTPSWPRRRRRRGDTGAVGVRDGLAGTRRG